eukprot:CAMPEP_0171787086 /NCGR_PEP_ID=MMETSP0991-20121206/63700_1 /TAXON_ID=483369 /ORGANISM="non described non described, Strain CCMP2098" /LENGTH=254 /DNA_ID=CAMNT_0012395989 /DNA_START=133 /DNA_END=893 /DNA_ORIENTATION=-
MLRANALLLWNKTVFLPRPGRGGHQWDFEDPRQVAVAAHSGSPVTGSAPFGVFASHCRYHAHLHTLVPDREPAASLPQFSSHRLAGKGDVLVVTTVRDPVKRLRSAWRYYLGLGVLKSGTTIQDLLLARQRQQCRQHKQRDKKSIEQTVNHQKQQQYCQHESCVGGGGTGESSTCESDKADASDYSASGSVHTEFDPNGMTAELAGIRPHFGSSPIRGGSGFTTDAFIDKHRGATYGGDEEDDSQANSALAVVR